MEEYQKNEKIYKNLVSILKLFKNRPYHLAKYLIENKAFNEEFLEKLTESEKLNELSKEESNSLVKAVYFIDISQMSDFFNSIASEFGMTNSKVDLTTELNRKLDDCLEKERYEDAIRIRDYMNKHGIKRISDNE